MPDERSGKSIDQMEAEAGTVEDTVEAPPSPDDPWAGQARKKDEYSDRDAKPRVKIYTLGIPNKPMKDGAVNPAYRRLCLDSKLAIAPRDLIRCIVFHRTYPNIAQIPYKEQSKDEPWKNYLGYSMDGIKPTPDSTGKFMKFCSQDVAKNLDTGEMGWKESPFLMCSQPTVFKDGEPQETSLDVRECPWGRWGNSMSLADREKYKIKADTRPLCNDHIILYCWDLDIMVPFRAYFKVTSLGSARDFLGSCSRGVGDDITKYPFYAFEAQITVEDHDEYATAKIMNTNKFTDPNRISPIVNWFEANKDIFVQNTAVQMEDMKNKAEKAGEFKKEDYEEKK